MNEGDDFVLAFDGTTIRLCPKPSFEPIRSGRTDWNNEMFLDAGKALFGTVGENEEQFEE